MSDIRKWFMKHQDKNNGNASKPSKPTAPDPIASVKQEKPTNGGEESSGRRKSSKYFATEAPKPKIEKEMEKPPAKRKIQKSSDDLQPDVKPPSAKEIRKVYADEEFVHPNAMNKSDMVTPVKILKTVDTEENDDDEAADELGGTPLKASGKGPVTASAGGRGRGRGGDWSDVPYKLLQLAFDKLNTCDLSRVGAVCVQWRKSLYHYHSKVLLFDLPVLLLPCKDGVMERRVYSIGETKFYDDVKLSVPFEKHCVVLLMDGL
ncbi:hypothetical protein GIB67_034369 [Kingdonia uniflora]|uniref:F-box domain-containing protein n=1 Tax=Kingdonia uniflora TaxID=39325 RepID=A0A7J7NRZ4_9MAGN|nr:hypothetical protein GIB67_034369 [Kingdonia uniflora]